MPCDARNRPPIFMHVIKAKILPFSNLPRKILKSWVGNVKSCMCALRTLEKLMKSHDINFQVFLDISFCVCTTLDAARPPGHNFSNLMYFKKGVKYVRESLVDKLAGKAFNFVDSLIIISSSFIFKYGKNFKFAGPALAGF